MKVKWKNILIVILLFNMTKIEFLFVDVPADAPISIYPLLWIPVYLLVMIANLVVLWILKELFIEDKL